MRSKLDRIRARSGLLISNRWGLVKNRLSALIIIVLVALVTLVILGVRNETNSLPSKYLGACNPVGGSILFNGVDPGEGMVTIQRNKPTLIQTSNFYGTNIYLALGGRHQSMQLLAHPKDVTSQQLSTTITVPATYKQGATPLHIYSTILTGECIDRWTEVYIQ